jgi:WD40 repeat protein
LEHSLKIIKENELKGHNGAIYKLVYDSFLDVIYSAGGDGWVVKWDASGQNEDGLLIAKTDAKIFSMLCIPEKELIIAGDMDGHMYWIDTKNNQIISRVAAHQKSIFDIIKINDHQIASAGKDGYIILWSLHEYKPEISIRVNHKGIRSLIGHPASQFILAGGSDHHIYKMQLADYTVSTYIPNAHENTVFSLQLYNNDLLISGGRDAHLKSWSLDESPEQNQSLPAHWYTINDMLQVDKKWLITASRDKSIRIWSLPDLAAVKLLDVQKGGHINSVNSLAWVPNHRLLFSAGDDRIIKMWKIL